MATRIQIRRDTTANWTGSNPVLASGEFGLDTTTGSLKIGNGTTAWSSLIAIGSGLQSGNLSLVSGSYEMTATDDIIFTTPPGGSITLPAAASVIGKRVVITGAHFFLTPKGTDQVLGIPAPYGLEIGHPSVVSIEDPDTIKGSVIMLQAVSSAGINGWIILSNDGPRHHMPNWDGLPSGMVLTTTEDGYPVWAPPPTGGEGAGLPGGSVTVTNDGTEPSSPSAGDWWIHPEGAV
jgi:hypothetical protein